MFCRNCGQQINPGASFCGSCGEPVSKTPEANAGQSKQPVTPASQTPITPPAQNPQTPPRQNQQPYQAPPTPQPGYPQQPYQNQQFRQNAAPVYAAPPQPPQSQSNSVLLIIVIVILFFLVAAAGILLFIKPGYLLHRDNGSSGIQTMSETQISVQSESGSTLTASETVTTAQIVSETAAAAQTEPDGAVVITDYPQDLIGGYDPSEDASRLYSTSQRPSFNEFEWCYGQFGFIREAPEGANYIASVKDYNGGWKAMIIYNPDDPNGIFTRELDNVIITVDDNNLVQVVIDWYLLAPDYSEISYLDDMEDSVFNGSVTNTGISANGPALINIDNFWNNNGKQYATGFLTTQDGTNAFLALVRP